MGLLSFERFEPEHRARLKALAATPEWSELLERGDALDAWRAEVRVPPSAPGQQSKANEYLRERNGERVREMIAAGVTDEETLLRALGDWETALEGDDPFPVVFLGLVVTLDCSFLPRCLYCNQLWLPRRLTLEDYKAILDEVAEPVPPYVYVTGGEPLILGAEIWGDDGLVAHATRLGSAVNVNTNATLITPLVALALVKSGTAKLHISLDTHDEETQERLLGGPDRWGAVLRGLLNVQIAREVLGVDHPVIHVNSVLTSRNLFGIPELLRFLLSMRRLDDTRYSDLAFHLIPVGGSENALIRPTAAEWERFYTRTWDEMDRVWAAHEANRGVPPDDREPLARAVPFASPWLRAEHRIPLAEYCRRAGRGEYWQGALGETCYVAPTQAYVLPDGSQHWCGAHAIRQPPALGDATGAGVRARIRAARHELARIPNEWCTGCAGATCVINQAAERNLRAQIREWVA